MEEPDKLMRFEQVIMPHLDAAYNLARWLTRNEHDAEDIVQEACLRAFKFFGGFRGENSRAWLLMIVRNTSYTWLKQNRAQELATVFDDELNHVADEAPTPSQALLQNTSMQAIREAMEQLPVEFREVVILRELESMSYKEIADIANVPMGTVMSRLARARKMLQERLAGFAPAKGEAK